jgi:uncharacterized membrane protein YGL010W
MKPRLEQLFREYAACHRHPTNRLTHKIAIPLIVFHIMAMLDWIKLPVNLPFEIGGAAIPLSVGHISYLATVAYYAMLHIPLAGIMAVLMAPLFLLAAVTPWPVVVALAVVGWVVQLAGHSVREKNRPAFVTNMQQALIGPLYFVAVLLGFYKPVYSAPARAAE